MQPYKIFSCHKTGASHIEKGIVCEDYSLCYENDSISICAISDGHGDINCFRSAMGAKIACESAIRQIKVFFSYGKQTRSALDRNSDIALNQLEKSIIADWTKAVEYDIYKNPFSEQELSCLSEDIQKFYRENTRPQKAYGCTLIASAVTDHCWFAIQIGDGICTAIFDDGVYLNPIPADDEGCVGNRSTSICSSDAIRSFRHYYGKVLPRTIFITSDGIEESFSEKDLNKCYYTISCWFNSESYDEAQKHIEDLLPKISIGGSGDDVSLAVIADPSYPAVMPKQTIEEVNHRFEICLDNTEKLKAKYEKTIEDRDMLISENETAKQRIGELESEIETLKRRMNEISEKLQYISEVENEYADAEKQFEKMNNYKKSADAFWRNKNKILSLGIKENEFFQDDS